MNLNQWQHLVYVADGTSLKVYVNGVDVSVLISREMYFDKNGKPITTSLKDHTKEIIKEKYTSLDDFLNKWNSTDRKEAIIAELQEQGVMVEALYEAVDKQVDLFDLICHVAYDQKPLTRKDRANNVKKRNYFTKYGEQAKKVLSRLYDNILDRAEKFKWDEYISRLTADGELSTAEKSHILIVRKIYDNRLKALKSNKSQFLSLLGI
jgi:type I restriction enzyme R subunit